MDGLNTERVSSFNMNMNTLALRQPQQSKTAQTSAPETERQDLLQLPKVGRADTRDGVPALGRVEPGRAAAGVVARGDVVERVGREGVDRVHERVQEPERGQARGEARRVEQRDEARERRRRGGGAPDEA